MDRPAFMDTFVIVDITFMDRAAFLYTFAIVDITFMDRSAFIDTIVCWKPKILCLLLGTIL